MIRELTEAARRLGIQVRLEKGSFRGGGCLVGGEPYVVLNKLHPPDLHFAILAESLRDQPLDELFLTPAVRSAMLEVWRRKAPAAPPAGPADAD